MLSEEFFIGLPILSATRCNKYVKDFQLPYNTVQKICQRVANNLTLFIRVASLKNTKGKLFLNKCKTIKS
jgi:hypothetical protein